MKLTIGPCSDGRYHQATIGKDETYVREVVCRSKYTARITANGRIVDEERWNRKTGL